MQEKNQHTFSSNARCRNLRCEVGRVMKRVVRSRRFIQAHPYGTTQRFDLEREMALDSHIILLGGIALVTDEQLDDLVHQ